MMDWLDGTREWLAGFCPSPLPLSNLRVWIGYPKDDASAVTAAEYKRVLRELGATILDNGSPSWPFSQAYRAAILQADALIVFAAAPGAAAEALDLSRRPEEDDRVGPGKRLRVYMPDSFKEGYVYRRLRHLQTYVLEFSRGHEVSGQLCKHVVDDALAVKRDMEHKREMETREFSPLIGIVTALPIEFNAVCAALGETRPHVLPEPSFREYAHGSIDAAGHGSHRVVVVRSGLGNNAGAVATERMLTDYRTLRHVFMVGIAGGLPRRGRSGADVRLGDVVMSGEFGVVQYDLGKRHPDRFEHTHRPRPPSAQWLSLATSYCGGSGIVEGCWEPLDKLLAILSADRPNSGTDKPRETGDPEKVIRRYKDRARVDGRPMVHLGSIGSGNSVVKDAQARDQLARDIGLIGYEMEGSGVSEGTWQNSAPYFVVRGICDYADETKNKVWQPYAAAVAAAHAVHLIGSMPPFAHAPAREA